MESGLIPFPLFLILRPTSPSFDRQFVNYSLAPNQRRVGPPTRSFEGPGSKQPPSLSAAPGIFRGCPFQNLEVPYRESFLYFLWRSTLEGLSTD